MTDETLPRQCADGSKSSMNTSTTIASCSKKIDASLLPAKICRDPRTLSESTIPTFIDFKEKMNAQQVSPSPQVKELTRSVPSALPTHYDQPNSSCAESAASCSSSIPPSCLYAAPTYMSTQVFLDPSMRKSCVICVRQRSDSRTRTSSA